MGLLEAHIHNLAVEEDSFPWQCYRTFLGKTLIGNPESHVSFCRKKCEERAFTMIDNTTQTIGKSGSIVSPRKRCWAGKLSMFTTGHSSPCHYWMRDSFTSRELQVPARMRGDQQITHHIGNLHQKMVGMGWPLRGENLLITTCKKDTYMESPKHLLRKTFREMRACA